MEWIDLEIGNIPSDFFVNERYEIESKEKDWVDYRQSDCNRLTSRHIIVLNLTNGGTFLYRYRLNPLEPMKLTYKFLADLNKGSQLSFNEKLKFIEKEYGRPVEIIEE